MRWQRRVFLMGGFDPRSPRHLHRLLRAAVVARPADGAEVRIAPLAPGWRLDWTHSGQHLATRCTVLAWDDLVRARWPQGLRGLLRAAARVYGRALPDARYMRTLARHARPGLLMGLTPLALLAACALGGVALAGAAAALGAPTLLALPAGMAAALGLLAATARPARAAWMLGLLDLSDALARADDPVLTARVDAMAAEVVRAAEAADADELLLVGHSVGSNWAVAVLARALRQAPWLGTRGPALRLLTLGQTLPLGNARTAGVAGRADVALLAATPQLHWQDVSAAADWAAFARLPPWVGAPQRCARCEAHSPRFHAQLTASHYAALKRDRHALHMQYLRAPDRPGGWDIVQALAGPPPPSP